MLNSYSQDGQDSETPNDMFGKATRFGERFGFPALVSFVLIISLMYGLYYVLRYEVAYTQEKVSAMNDDMDMMQIQHANLLKGQDTSLEFQKESISILCALCQNQAADLAELRKCNCTTSK